MTRADSGWRMVVSCGKVWRTLSDMWQVVARDNKYVARGGEAYIIIVSINYTCYKCLQHVAKLVQLLDSCGASLIPLRYIQVSVTVINCSRYNYSGDRITIEWLRVGKSIRWMKERHCIMYGQWTKDRDEDSSSYSSYRRSRQVVTVQLRQNRREACSTMQGQQGTL